MNSQGGSLNNFTEKMDRLKTCLGKSKDIEVAYLLGMGKTTLSERKRRGSFPDSELVALATTHPELGIDVNYVLTGITSAATALIDAKERRIAAQVAAGATLQEVRDNEVRYAPESLGALVALLERCNATERAALHALLTSMLAGRK